MRIQLYKWVMAVKSASGMISARNTPLMVDFSDLYTIAINKSAMIAECRSEAGMVYHFLEEPK